MSPRTSNTRTTTPPITPPAMAPVLTFVGEIDAAAAVVVVVVDDDDVFCSAEDWGDVKVTTAVWVAEAGIVEKGPEMLVVEEAPPVSGVKVPPAPYAEEDPAVSGVEEDPVIVGDGEEVGVLVLVVGRKAPPDLLWVALPIFHCRVDDEKLIARELLCTNTLNQQRPAQIQVLPCIQSQDAQYEPQ